MLLQDPIYERLDRLEARYKRECLFGGSGKGGKGGGTPSAIQQPIDPAELIRLQAQANRVNVNSPYGTAAYSGPNKNTLTISPTANQQEILGQQEGSQIALGNVAQQLIPNLPTSAMTFEGVQGLPGLGDFGAERDKTEQAVFQRAVNLMNPEFARSQEQMEQTLATRGIPVGNAEARNYEVERFLRAKNQSLEGASQDAVLAGAAEQQRLFNQALTARQQGVGETQALYNQPLQYVSALLGQQQFQPPTAYAPTPIDVTGSYTLPLQQAQIQLQNQQYGQGVASQNMGGLLNLGGTLGAAYMLSTKQAKTDDAAPETILEAVKELPVRAWRYKEETGLGTERHIGPYAEDWQAATGLGDGKSISAVDGIGVALQATKELLDRVEALEAA
jgi:hypothetical protein